MTDPEKVAASLTKAQRKRILQASPRGAAMVCEFYGTNGLAQSAFDRMMTRLYVEHHEPPLVTPYVHGGWELTPLGTAVRAHLLKGNPDNGE